MSGAVLLRRSCIRAPLLRGQMARAYGAGAHHDDDHHRDVAGGLPRGNLFGETPAADGSKRVREDWELIWYWGMGGAFVLGTVGLMTRPNSKPSAWARAELEQRQRDRAAHQ